MFVKNVKDAIASFGKSINSPIFIKEYNNQNDLINQLEEIKLLLHDDETIKSLELDQLFIKLGDDGEKAICFELENSMLPILCLHDLCLTYDGQTAQMDFILITNKYIAVLESKRLSGDITVNSDGQFTRSFKNSNGKIYKKEAIYSPITQNERHISLLHKFLVDRKLIKYAPVISFVVLGNPKSIVDLKYAKKAIKEKIVRGDQLVERLKKELNKKSDINLSVVAMEKIAEALLDAHTVKEQSFIKKYQDLIDQGTSSDVSNDEENLLVDYFALLKSYRLKKSRELNYKAYMVFNNEQMDNLIKKRPTTQDELLSIKGFGPKKVELFGEDILNIFNEN